MLYFIFLTHLTRSSHTFTRGKPGYVRGIGVLLHLSHTLDPVFLHLYPGIAGASPRHRCFTSPFLHTCPRLPTPLPGRSRDMSEAWMFYFTFPTHLTRSSHTFHQHLPPTYLTYPSPVHISRRKLHSLLQHNPLTFFDSPSLHLQINNTKKPAHQLNWFHLPGNVLLSQGLASQLPSALKSLTSVFGMGTGVASSPSLPDYLVKKNIVLSKLDNVILGKLRFKHWLSPRTISIRQLHVSPHFHLGPINLIIFQGSY